MSNRGEQSLVAGGIAEDKAYEVCDEDEAEMEEYTLLSRADMLILVGPEEEQVNDPARRGSRISHAKSA